jgi:hypothetical protein
LNKNEHPVRAYSNGGYFAFGEDCDQETANTQNATYVYEDGKILEFEVRGLYTAGEAGLDIKIGNIFYGTEGYLELDGDTWKTYMGREKTPGASSEDEAQAQAAASTGGQDLGFMPAPGGGGHYQNFLTAVRSGKMEDLTCDIEEGFRSTVLPHLANISYRLGREVQFDGANEKFVNDKEADAMLSREYREPYVVEENV